ncbi:hypothetical protein PF005_g24894 [Phytophthora fragariae]|uniref:Uncharacterized protein n=1 Tax=Phytophthora fragariae TaxID=53985 RepID=A0A6A4CST8_9STRA|nr:hypothetical protein PF009_g20248 [Phytophthora fragariae]KAE9089187.1 hypothetical protein PF010_g19092 [Phytophthora fragariae]KAE9090025.1 hypothetical protein PF007_g19394 [Phytophthora fragariae]KAE9096677.1 hypothetical protein PF006_g23727 [Phytophthora fragariae]KAE9176544.1 hypothetical protein PF005_g24894 [Phytophthora fragariae]
MIPLLFLLEFTTYRSPCTAIPPIRTAERTSLGEAAIRGGAAREVKHFGELGHSVTASVAVAGTARAA